MFICTQATFKGWTDIMYAAVDAAPEVFAFPSLHSLCHCVKSSSLLFYFTH